MNKLTVAMKRIGGFMKRNAFYFMIVLCIASVATVIALAVTRDNGSDTIITIDPGVEEPVIKPNPDPEIPVKPKLTFIAPSNGTIKNDYSDLVWNPTLAQSDTHHGVDYVGGDLRILASAKGNVKTIGYDILKGNYVILTHEDGYETGYYSLEKPCDIKVGYAVTQGQLLGKMSATHGVELLDGDHLHFEMTLNGKLVNPLEVFVLDEK